jgi:hypothetical protein
MGVDYYTCHECGHNFPDCGDFFPCDCGCFYCNEECGERESTESDEPDDEGYYEEINTCKYCRLEAVTEHELLVFICKKYNIIYEDAVKECIEDLKNESRN